MLAGALLIFFAAFYLLGYRAANRQLNDLRIEIASKQRDLFNNEIEAKKLPIIEKVVKQLQLKLAKFNKKLPRQQELPQFIREITQGSQQASLRNVKVEPGVGKKSDLYSEIPIKLTFEGDFLGVFAFLRQTEQLERLTRVHDLTLKAKSGKPGEVEVQVSMNIYFSEG